MIEVVVVPSEIEAAYRQRPGEVVALLLGVAEQGRPRESIKAFAYAWSLVDHPHSPVPAVRLFKEDTYDQLDPDWGRTPREFWLRLLKKEIDAKGKK